MRAVGFLIVWFFLSASPALSQTRLTEATPLRQISLRHLVSLGDEDGPGIVGQPADVLRRENGEWVLTDDATPAEIQFFSPDGQWIRTLGRRGEGPGEFQMATYLQALPGDSLWVFDFLAMRITFFSPDLKVSHIKRLGLRPVRIADLGDGAFVVSGPSYSREAIGFPLHFMNSDGEYVFSFGADPPIQDASKTDLLFRSLAPGRNSRVWSADLTRYLLEEWAPDGTRINQLERSVAWFEPHEDYGAQPDKDAPPGPGIMDIHLDGEGLLWVAIHVPDPEWEEGYSEGKDPYGRPARKLTDFNRFYDTMLEVIDPEAGTVIASHRIDESVYGFTGSGEIITYQLGDDLIPKVKITEVRLSTQYGGEK